MCYLASDLDCFSLLLHYQACVARKKSRLGGTGEGLLGPGVESSLSLCRRDPPWSLCSAERGTSERSRCMRILLLQDCSRAKREWQQQDFQLRASKQKVTAKGFSRGYPGSSTWRGGGKGARGARSKGKGESERDQGLTHTRCTLRSGACPCFDTTVPDQQVAAQI